MFPVSFVENVTKIKVTSLARKRPDGFTIHIDNVNLDLEFIHVYHENMKIHKTMLTTVLGAKKK